MGSARHKDDLFVFSPDEVESSSPGPAWNILVVDDDGEVLASTRLVLAECRLFGRPLKLMQASSAREAREILKTYEDIAILLLDVVMEDDQAGLGLVDFVRSVLKNRALRIILRTGQGGYTPDLEIIEGYDINDYRTKQELTHQRLLSSLAAALRNYQDILKLQEQQTRLELFAKKSAQIGRAPDYEGFVHSIAQTLDALHPSRKSHTQVYLSTLGDTQLSLRRDDRILASNLHKVQVQGKQVGDIPDLEPLLENAEAREPSSEPWPYLWVLHGQGETRALIIMLPEDLPHREPQIWKILKATTSLSFSSLSSMRRLEQLAMTDEETGLPNAHKMSSIIENSPWRHQKILCLIHLDQFNDINDGLGFAFGALMVSAAAQRIREANPEAIVGRLQPSVLMVYGYKSQVDASGIMNLFKEDFPIKNLRIPLRISLGLAWDEEGLEAESLMKHAGIALNRAQHSQRQRFVYFRTAMALHLQWKMEVIDQLRHAFIHRRLEVWYQAQVDASTHACTGLEALLRWPGSAHDRSTPDIFIPLAEYSGLIIDIGDWVIQEASKTLRHLESEGFRGLRMAINLSITQFRRDDLVERLKEIGLSHDINPQQIELEITESHIIDEPERVIHALNRLQSHGYSLAIDDFGTGYSALSYLQDLPLNTVKIDKSFVQKLQNPSGQAIIQAVLDLCKQLNLDTVGEGVENHEQAELLRLGGCTKLQGFYFARPMPLNELKIWLTQEAPP